MQLMLRINAKSYENKETAWINPVVVHRRRVYAMGQQQLTQLSNDDRLPSGRGFL